MADAAAIDACIARWEECTGGLIFGPRHSLVAVVTLAADLETRRGLVAVGEALVRLRGDIARANEAAVEMARVCQRQAEALERLRGVVDMLLAHVDDTVVLDEVTRQLAQVRER